MNERIKELSDIAYKNHLARNPHSSYGRRSDYDREFAELIVEECCSRLSEETIRHDGYGYNQHELYNRLRKHFGVDK